MRILEIGGDPYIGKYAPGIVDYYDTMPGSPRGKALTFRRILDLRKRLKTGYYDLVVYHITIKTLAPWHRNVSVLKMAANLILACLLNFHKIAWHVFHYFFRGSTTPLIVIDTQDAPRITLSESRWLDRCRFWFMRELPANHMNLFLNMDRRCGDVINIQRNKFLRRNFSKIEPFGLGFYPKETFNLKRPEASEKIYDVFYAGANHTSTVRQRGLEELKALKAAGLRVSLPETRLTKDEFFQACAQSWLVWSPEGQGWDCYRHYEVLMAYSVPLINYPTVEHLWPLRNGEHCLYYEPGAGGLSDAVKKALLDKKALLGMAEQGRAHVLQHHARSQLVRHVLEKVGLLKQAESYLVDGLGA